MSDKNNDKNKRQAMAKPEDVMAELKSIRSKSAARGSILAKMRTAHIVANAANVPTATTRSKSLLERRITLPAPAFAALILLIAWLGYRNVKPLFVSSVSTPSVARRSKVTSPVLQPQTLHAPGADSSDSTVHDREIAFYIPTIGYVSHEKIQYAGKE